MTFRLSPKGIDFPYITCSFVFPGRKLFALVDNLHPHVHEMCEEKGLHQAESLMKGTIDKTRLFII